MSKPSYHQSVRQLIRWCKSIQSELMCTPEDEGDRERIAGILTRHVNQVEAANIPEVRISVHGGVSYVDRCPRNVKVTIVDHDSR